MRKIMKRVMKREIKKYVKKYVKKYMDKHYSIHEKKNIKNNANLINLINIDNIHQNFRDCSFDDLNEGDIVYSWTMTYSQKYLLKEEFKDYNMVKIGILLNKNYNNKELSIILKYDNETKVFTETNLYRDPGTSGSFGFNKINEFQN